MLRLNLVLIEKEINDAGLTKTELASMLGISRMHLNRLLGGECAPGNKVVSALLETFTKYTFNELFFLDGTSPNGDTGTDG